MSRIRKACEVLERGGIILYPTDTVYGLGVDALNVDAIERLHQLKGRDGKAFSVIVADIESAQEYVEVGERAEVLSRYFLPGPLTIILPKKDIIPEELTHHLPGLGIRIPDNDFCIQLAKEFGRPFVTTSANVSGEATKSTVPEILEQFGLPAQAGDRNPGIDYVVDIGELPPAQPSTLVELSGDGLTVIREGAISKEQILAALDAH